MNAKVLYLVKSRLGLRSTLDLARAGAGRNVSVTISSAASIKLRAWIGMVPPVNSHHGQIVPEDNFRLGDHTFNDNRVERKMSVHAYMREHLRYAGLQPIPNNLYADRKKEKCGEPRQNVRA